MKQPVIHQLGSTSADLLQPDTSKAKLTVYSISAFFVAALVWSMFANVLQVSTGSGQVIPEGHLQTIQNLDGGVVTEIRAKPGDKVEKGAVIAKLDPVYAGASLNETAEQIASLSATSVRLRGELYGLARFASSRNNGSADKAATLGELQLEFPPDLRENHAVLVRENTALFKTAMQEIRSAIASLEEQIIQKQLEAQSATLQLSTVTSAQSIARAELVGLQELLKSGAAGKAEVMGVKVRYNELLGQAEQLRLAAPRARSIIAQLNAQIDERIGNLQSRTAEQLNDAEMRGNALKAQMPALSKRSANTELVATATGTIKSMSITTTGQVVRPGETIAEIVPANSPLLIQVRVRPEDIAFIAPGMPALIKLTAFDFSVFGSLNGTVDRIATDSTTDDRGTIYYIVDVKALENHIERRGETWPVKVGMVANVDIVTGKQTIFQYFTKPIHRMTQSALRER